MNVPASSEYTQSRHTRWLQNPAFPAIASGLLAVLLYAVTLAGTYVYDDVQVVYLDTRVHNPHEWKRLWTTDYFDGGIDNLYRPITSSTYALEWFLHGDRPWIFHAINILLHGLAAASIAEFTRRVLRSVPSGQTAALCSGLLFAAHPVHVEAVANIVGRAELLCTTLIFTGLILLCKRPLLATRVVAVVSIGAIAVLCKEQGILQPLLWLFFAALIWRSIPPSAAGTAARERAAVKVFLLLTTWLWAGYLLLREHFLKFEWDRTYIDPIIQPLIKSHGLDRLLMPIVLIGHYTALLLWPAHLAADYGGDVIGSITRRTDPFLWLGFLAIVMWVIGFAVCLKTFIAQSRRGAENAEDAQTQARFSPRLGGSARCRFSLFCLLGLALTYGMIGNILTLIATNFAERLLYLPSAFLLMIVGTIVADIPLRPRVLLMGVVLILASIRTVAAASDWNHPLTLFQHGLANQPKSLQLHLLLSKEYRKAGDIPAARALLVEACNLYPSYWRSWMFRAEEDMDDHDLSDAEMSLKMAMKAKADPVLIGVADRLRQLKSATQPSTKP